MSLTNAVADLIPVIRGLIKDQQRTDGRDTYEYLGDNRFTLSESFISASSIIVYKNGAVVDDDNYEYDVASNQVIIDFLISGEDLEENDIVLITYSFYKKYSDVEILGYISSSLSYFSQNRYSKIFEINGDDEIIAENNLNPTLNELYFIALISSILIDPQNIEVRIPEFTLTANRTISDQEQISNAFRQFMRFHGEFDFEPDSTYKLL